MSFQMLYALQNINSADNLCKTWLKISCLKERHLQFSGGKNDRFGTAKDARLALPQSLRSIATPPPSSPQLTASSQCGHRPVGWAVVEELEKC